MKKTKQCPKCRSIKIGWLRNQVDRDSRSNWSQSVVRVVGNVNESEFGEVQKPDNVVGELEAFVCTECGFYESYVAAPAELPWDKMKGFQWINASHEDHGPYR